MASGYVDQYFERLKPLIDANTVEIVINPDRSVWVEQRGQSFMQRVDLDIDDAFIRDAATTIVAELEGGATVSEKTPVASVSFEYDGTLVRAQIVLAPAVRQGVSLSLRFYQSNSEMIEPAYLEGKPVDASKLRRDLSDKVLALSKTDLPAALMLCVSEKLNIVVSGGTSSGKTTVARWLVSQVSDDERIITIEDVPDLMPTQPNQVVLVSKRDAGQRSPDKLLQATLRMRPDRIILSEVTGADAYTFLKAINTGHGGSITTIHADTAELAVQRMAQTALEADCKMQFTDMIGYVSRSIDVIIHVAKKDGKRGVMQLFQPATLLED